VDTLAVGRALARDVALLDQRAASRSTPCSPRATRASSPRRSPSASPSSTAGCRPARPTRGPWRASSSGAARAELGDALIGRLGPLEGTVVLTLDARFQPSPGLRAVRVHALSVVGDALAAIAPWRGRLQGAALAGAGALELSSALEALGVSRLAAPRPPPGRRRRLGERRHRPAPGLRLSARYIRKRSVAEQLVLGELAPVGAGQDVVGVLERQIHAGDDREPDPEVELGPLPAHAGRRILGGAARELRLEPRVARRGRDAREELPAADCPRQRQLEAPGELGLVAGAVHARELLRDVLAEEGEAARARAQVGADLALVVAGDGQREALERPVEQVEVAAVEGPSSTTVSASSRR